MGPRDVGLYSNTELVSEYTVPIDFEVVSERSTITMMNRNSKNVKVEKLYLHGQHQQQQNIHSLIF